MHRQRQDHARCMVQVVKKTRFCLEEELFKKRVLKLKINLVSMWAHNALYSQTAMKRRYAELQYKLLCSSDECVYGTSG